jgi:Fe-S cluster assembly scaffold protein SufB
MKIAYNLLWITPKRHKPRETPLSQTVQESIEDIAMRNDKADILLWTDSRRLSTQQQKLLCAWKKPRNIQLHDLQKLTAYARSTFYNTEDKNKNWRKYKDSLIWQQVDSARILVAINCPHEQVFYADTDINNFTTHTPEVQNKLAKKGILFNGHATSRNSEPLIENQLFGFDNRGRHWFEQLYRATIKDVKENQRNGHTIYAEQADKDFSAEEQQAMLFEASYNNAYAAHGKKGFQQGEGGMSVFNWH